MKCGNAIPMSKSKSKFKHYSLDTILRSVGIAPLILDLIDIHEWSDLRPGHFSQEESSCAHGIGDNVGPTAGLSGLNNSKTSCPISGSKSQLSV